MDDQSPDEQNAGESGAEDQRAEDQRANRDREARRSESKPEPVVAGVRFKRAGRIYYFDAQREPQLAVGDRVIVETAQGLEAGEVVIAPAQVMQAQLGTLKPIQRMATWEDLNGMARLRAGEPEALSEAVEQIARHRLPMRAVAAEYTFDGSRLTISFTSDKKRVDFRALVRDLARSLGTRVLLRQVGPRDKAKLLGGIDRCGRELCCSSWMPEFQPISIRMAKTQGLPLNPSEISGVCGKLLCCLAFEDEQYRDMRTGMPKPGARLTSAVGRGRVVDVNLLTRKVTVAWEDGTRVIVDGDEFADQRERWKRAFGEEQGGAAPRAKPPAKPERPRGGRSRDRGRATAPRDAVTRDEVTRKESQPIDPPIADGDPVAGEGRGADRPAAPAESGAEREGARGRGQRRGKPRTGEPPSEGRKRKRRRKKRPSSSSPGGAAGRPAGSSDAPTPAEAADAPAKQESPEAGKRKKRRRARRRRKRPSDGGTGERGGRGQSGGGQSGDGQNKGEDG
jgi:cell fate regulator YaaT (PSP1 superfamily)